VFHLSFPHNVINNGAQLTLTVAVAAGAPHGASIDIPIVSQGHALLLMGRLQVLSLTVP
jgi:hypothetical protein